MSVSPKSGEFSVRIRFSESIRVEGYELAVDSITPILLYKIN
jgi:hypothetical protein